MPTRAKRPMAVLLIPTVASQYESVDSVNNSGKPLTNPKQKITNVRVSLTFVNSLLIFMDIIYFINFKKCFRGIVGLAPS